MVEPEDTQKMSQALLPCYSDDTKKSKYLSFRVANFSVTESCQLAKCSFRSVKRWREADASFASLDGSGLTELRQLFGKEYLNIEFTRNYRLVLQKDFEVLAKSVRGVILDDREHQYLLKLRSHYNPQQLVLLKQLLGQMEPGDGFDFTKLTLTIRREREEITVGAK